MVHARSTTCRLRLRADQFAPRLCNGSTHRRPGVSVRSAGVLRPRLRHPRVLGLIGAALLVAACAAQPGPEVDVRRGVSGPVTWEVTDVGQLVSSSSTWQGMRWSFVIVLKETAGSVIRFERVARGSYTLRAEQIGGTTVSQPFERTLPANGELRYSSSESWGWVGPGQVFGGAATLPRKTAEYRFIGKTGGGQPVEALVRVHLDRNVGKVVTPLPTAGSLSSATTLAPTDLVSVAGSWRGSYRIDKGEFDIPLQVVVQSNGSFEVAENDPVTIRSRGTFSIREGRIACSWGRDTGNFTLHEAEGRRILAGRVSGPRDSPAGTPPSTLGYTVRLERPSP